MLILNDIVCSDEQQKLLEKAAFKGYDLTILLSKTSDGRLSFNAAQLGVIIRGYDSSADVRPFTILDDYGQPIFSADQMEEILSAIVDGMNPGILTKLNVNDIPIYSDRMMWLIHEAYMYGLDVDAFALIVDDKTVYNDSQACEIFLGEKAGLDVSKYNILADGDTPIYSADEMRGLRLEQEAKIQDEYSYINSRAVSCVD